MIENPTARYSEIQVRSPTIWLLNRVDWLAPDLKDFFLEKL